MSSTASNPLKEKLDATRRFVESHEGPSLNVLASAKTGKVRFAMLPEGVHWHEWSYWCQRASRGALPFLIDGFTSLVLHPTDFLRLLAAGPWRTVEHQQRKQALLASGLAVALVSIVLAATRTLWAPGVVGATEWLWVGGSTLLGLASWLVASGLVAVLSYVFSGKTRFFTLLVSTGFATLPWLFLVPLQLLQWSLADVLPGLSAALTLGGLALWVWTVSLFVLALKYSLRLTLGKTLLLLAAPFTLGLLSLFWTAGFLATLINITKYSHF